MRSPASLVAWTVLLVAGSAAPASASVMTRFPVPTKHAKALAITPGTHGDLWFSEYGADRIGRITTKGRITEYRFPTLKRPARVVTARNGSIWVAGTNRFARVTLTTRRTQSGRRVATAKIVEFHKPTQGFQGQVTSLAASPDGSVWYAGFGCYGQISPSGKVAEHVDRASLGGRSIAVTPQGTVWLSSGTGAIARLGSGGAVVQSLRLPADPAPVAGVARDARVGPLVAAPDGSVWSRIGYGAAQNADTSRVVRMAPSGAMSVPAVDASELSVIAGPGGRVWYATGSDPWSLNPAGPAGEATTAFAPFRAPGPLLSIAPDAGGDFWFTQGSVNAIGRVRLTRGPG